MTKKRIIFCILCVVLVFTLCFLNACTNASEEVTMQTITDTNPSDFPPYPSVQEATPTQEIGPGGGAVIPGKFTGYGNATVDYGLARSKGLIGAEDTYTDIYLKLQAVYRKAFFSFIDGQGVLSKTDTELVQAKESYVAATVAQMNVYQKYGSFGLKYVYLDNDFAIEQLDQADLSLLEDPTPQNMPAIEDMVKRTYISVITVHDPNRPGVISVGRDGLFGHDAMSNAICIEIRYTGKLGPKATFKQLQAADNRVKTIASTLQAKLRAQLGCNVAVFVTLI
jgi:hypothetical protein